jgi:hypothetical protein
MDVVDGEVFHPHVEVGTPLVSVADLDGRDGGRLLPHWVPDAEMALLHWLWSGAVGNLYGRPVDVVVCDYSYRNGARHVRHRIRYASRSFPGWATWTRGQGGARYGRLGNRHAEAFRTVVVDSLDPEKAPASPFICQQRDTDDACPCGREVNPRPEVGDVVFRGTSPPVCQAS